MYMTVDPKILFATEERREPKRNNWLWDFYKFTFTIYT